MNWKRYILLALVFSLLLSLRLVWSALTWQPQVVPAKKVAASRAGIAGLGIRTTRPPVVIPDLLDGYIFNAERKLDPAATLVFGGGKERISPRGGIDELTYSGSIMVGLKQQALVAFPARIRGPEGRDKKVILHRVLAPGDEFNGYKVAAVEPLRLVFTLNGEKVVKQLYDKDKVRSVVSVTLGKGLPTAGRRADLPPTRIKAVPPVRSSLRAVTSKRQSLVRNDTPGVNKPASRSSRRMQRLRLENPDIIIPAVPGGVSSSTDIAPAR